MDSIAPLPIYPSTQARKAFTPSQLANFQANLSNTVAKVVALPPEKRDTPSTRVFISSYASDVAQQVLDTLIWEDAKLEKHSDCLHHHVLFLAEKIASSGDGLGIRTLLDLCIAFPSKTNRLRSILSAGPRRALDLSSAFALEVVPAFTPLLSQTQSLGLYGIRKTARCLTSLLRPSTPDLVRTFAYDRNFIIALAHAYDEGLAIISRSYGGIRTSAGARTLDHWERIWLDTKVDLIDAFHIIVTTMVRDISAASGTYLVEEADRTFGIVFALLDVTSQSAIADAVPFLNRPLVADYQHAYDLNRTLSSALRHEDTRLDLLESTLRSLDIFPLDGRTRDPGALKLILHSSGIIPGTSAKVTPSVQPSLAGKGGAPAHTRGAELDAQVKQVLEIFPDHSPEYILRLLTHPSLPFRGNAERVIEALLEGTAPGEDALGEDDKEVAFVPDAPIERRNVFDQDDMDLSRVHVGKKNQDITLTKDRADAEQMKAEILRLAEAMPEDSGSEESDDDEANPGTIKIFGDGEHSDDGDSGEERRVDPIKPETVLELAYIRDPKLFERDAQTRRSKQRADLKQQTGWTDEQIEGWRIMLERNPRKHRILEKHEFSGNRLMSVPVDGGSREPSGSGQRSRARGRGRGRGGGRGRGRGEVGGDGRGDPKEKNEEIARRANKERHKSDHRKRGHDKKMTGHGSSG